MVLNTERIYTEILCKVKTEFLMKKSLVFDGLSKHNLNYKLLIDKSRTVGNIENRCHKKKKNYVSTYMTVICMYI